MVRHPQPYLVISGFRSPVGSAGAGVKDFSPLLRISLEKLIGALGAAGRESCRAKSNGSSEAGFDAEIPHCVARPRPDEQHRDADYALRAGGKIARHSVRNDSFCCGGSGLVRSAG
jgi:hypothetical protein